MKFLASFLLINLLFVGVFAQIGISKESGIPIAKVNGKIYTSNAISDNELRGSLVNERKNIESLRTEELAKQISDILVTDEAKFRKISVEKLLQLEVKNKVPNPLEAQIKEIYEANQSQLGDTTYEKIRPRIVAFLRAEPEKQALFSFVNRLKTKYKVVLGIDVNSASLKPTDVLATVNGKTILDEKYEELVKPKVYDFQATNYEQVKDYFEQNLFLELINAEAKRQNVQSQDIVRQEISDKMRDFTDAEREKLQNALIEKLFNQAGYEFLLKAPIPIVQKIDLTSGVSRGRADAPVTIVMFTDFQCPACKATHPFLQEAMKDYQDKIRFIVRNYPLEIHENSYIAAQAAQAANAQGKFFEYTEILYQNQEKLDIVSLKKYAADLGLNSQKFNLELTSGKYKPIVDKDLAEGKYLNITSTPTIFVNGVKIRAKFYTTEVFKNAIEKALNK
jgi:protein-disulfide isomerase